MNSNLNGQRAHDTDSAAEEPKNGARAEAEPRDSRLVVDRVQGFLERVSFPPARPPFVGKQVEADVRIRAVVGERDQVSAGVNDHDEFVPLRAVSYRQLDLAQREVTGA